MLGPGFSARGDFPGTAELPDAAQHSGDHSRHQCAIAVTDTFLRGFIGLLDQENVSLLAPFFSVDVVSEFGGDFPPEVHVGLDETLANLEEFNQFTDNVQHEVRSITRSHHGWQIFATIETNASFDLPDAGIRFVGQQSVTLRFNEDCLIDSFIAQTFGEFLPLE